MKLTITRCVNCYTTALINCLHSDLKFGRKRTLDFIESVSTLFDSINEDVLTMQECKEYNQKFLGIDLDIGGDSNDREVETSGR